MAFSGLPKWSQVGEKHLQISVEDPRVTFFSDNNIIFLLEDFFVKFPSLLNIFS